mmetsp:Transcript_10779/g.15201  ORF Transcript_10779/g.15201 Transcript_10779/m.15201 type:complete len:371 (+) Transcript_10779:50-1162(+)
MTNSFDPFGVQSSSFDPFGVSKTKDVDQSDSKSYFSDLNMSLISNDTSFQPDFRENSREADKEDSYSQFSSSKFDQMSYSSDLFESDLDKSFESLQHKRDDKLINSFGEIEEEIPINVSLHEIMVCAYDMTKNSINISVQGTIRIEPIPELENTPLFLSLNDPEANISNVTVLSEFIKDVSSAPRKREKLDQRILKVNYPGKTDFKPIEIATYTCRDSLRPVPIIVQTKVRVDGKICKVGVKIKVNPSLSKGISNVCVLLAVPPTVKGTSMKISREGTSWDAIKRIVAWVEPSMSCGEDREVMIQFEISSAQTVSSAIQKPIFPILVRCDGSKDQLSKIGIKESRNKYEITQIPYKVSVNKSFRVFHRKH